jgi:hypothetical protein
MFSLLQLESDLSDANSVVTCTKAKLKSSRKQRDLTILDAIIGPRSPRIKNVSSKNKDKSFTNEEKVYIQRRNAALDEYMGSKCQVVPINKDLKKTLFKDNTTLHQTIKVSVRVTVLHLLSFSQTGEEKYSAQRGIASLILMPQVTRLMKMVIRFVSFHFPLILVTSLCKILTLVYSL